MENKSNKLHYFGHADKELRGLCLDWVEAYLDDEDIGQMSYRGKPIEIERLFGLLWNCTDCAPRAFYNAVSSICEIEPIRQTYAACVRALHRELN